MRIVEEFILSKTGKRDDCEDLIVVGTDYALLLDGATSKKAQQINGISCGQWAVNVIAEAMAQADLGQTPWQILNYLNMSLKEKLCQVNYIQPPSACIVFYNNIRRELVRYGDAGVMIDGKAFNRRTKLDEFMSEKRSKNLEQAIGNGKTVQELLQADIGRESIIKDLQQMHLYANQVCEWGYPVINGDCIVEEFIDVFPVARNSDVVLASDGYPVLKRTLAESEAILQKLIITDPLCMYTFKSTKGLYDGQVSFDDRSYLHMLT